MSFELRPKKKEAGTCHISNGTWLWMLEAGVGLPIGCAGGIVPGTYLYQPDTNGVSPTANDGFIVQAKDAKLMAQVGRMVVVVQQDMEAAFALRSETFRVKATLPGSIYRVPARKEDVALLQAFCDWAERSGGFTVC